MNSIKVFLYSYKNKNLLEQVLRLKNSESKNNNIVYYIYDQNNLNREKHFKDIDNTVYRHIFWYDYSGICEFRKEVLLINQKYDFYLELNPNVNMPNNWDETLINNLNNKSVISGKNKPLLKIEYFKVLVDRKSSNTILLSNYISTDLIFTRSVYALNLVNLEFLKFNGQELYASLLFNKNSIDIFSLPDNFYNVDHQENLETYRSYSINHGYNKLVNLIKNSDWINFETFHNIDFKNLQEMPYQNDDVYYTSFKFNIDEQKDPKFHKQYSRIDII